MKISIDLSGSYPKICDDVPFANAKFRAIAEMVENGVLCFAQLLFREVV